MLLIDTLFRIIPIQAASFANPGLHPPGRNDLHRPVRPGLNGAGQLSKGKFLVAGRQLNDPNFAQTVVFLIHHDRQGAMGLIINRPTKAALSEVFPDIQGLQQGKQVVYFGGPVAVSGVLLLLRSGAALPEARHVFDDIYISASPEVLQQLVAEDRFRAYAGYAGWAPGQLEREVAGGGWHILPADVVTLFETPAGAIWPKLIQRSSIRWTGL